MILLDTNYLLRFLTNDIKDQALEAKKIVSSKKVYIPVIVFAETVYFLRNYYEVEKVEVCNKLWSLINQSNIFCESFVANAFDLYKTKNISFYDCLIWSEAKSKGFELKTFDKNLLKNFKNTSKS